jgi:hypothetical protein
MSRDIAMDHEIVAALRTAIDLPDALISLTLDMQPREIPVIRATFHPTLTAQRQRDKDWATAFAKMGGTRSR